MLTLVTTKRFEKDLILMQKRGKNCTKIKAVIDLLLNEIPLPLKNRDHALIGNYAHRRECHIEPDWLLIYIRRKNDLILERTGSHSDLFK